MLNTILVKLVFKNSEKENIHFFSKPVLEPEATLESSVYFIQKNCIMFKKLFVIKCETLAVMLFLRKGQLRHWNAKKAFSFPILKFYN